MASMFGHRKVPCGLQILNPLFSLSIFAALSSVVVTAALSLPLFSVAGTAASSPPLSSSFPSLDLLADLFFCSDCFISLSVQSDGVVGDPINNGAGASDSDTIGSSTVDFNILNCSCVNHRLSIT